MGGAARLVGGLKSAALAAALLWAAAAAGEAPTTPRPLPTRALPLNPNLTADARVGGLRPLGLLEIPHARERGLSLSQISGLAWDDDDGVLYAVTDKGALFHLHPEFTDERPTGITVLRAVALADNEGKPLRGRRTDAEGLDILNGRNGRVGDAELLVSFEREPRIVRYRPDGQLIGELPLPSVLADRGRYRDSNRMLEAVCHDPKLGVLTVPEAPLIGERTDRTHIHSLDGRQWLYPLPDGFSISAIECLGGGELLVLERDFGRLFTRRVVALRRVHLPPQPSESEPVNIETVAVLDAAEGYEVDNFEGLTRHQDRRFFTVSDDNDLFLQRTLLLYFELALAPARTGAP